MAPNLIRGQKLIEIPKATHFEKGVPVSRLVEVKRIQSDFNEDLFLAMPWEIAVNKKGMIYVYDAKQEKFFFFSNKYLYLGQFLETGQGPGEVHPNSSKLLYITPDGNLNVCDGGSKRILQFSEAGKFINGIRLPSHRNSRLPSRPLTDRQGNLHIYSMNDGIIDKMDPK